MIELWLEGGFSMFFVLALGIAVLVSSAMFARRPDPRKVETLRALAASLLFAALTGLATNLSAVFHKVPNRPEWAHSPDLNLIVMTGLGESPVAPHPRLFHPDHSLAAGFLWIPASRAKHVTSRLAGSVQSCNRLAFTSATNSCPPARFARDIVDIPAKLPAAGA